VENKENTDDENEEEEEQQEKDDEEEIRLNSKFDAAVNPVQARASSLRRSLLKPVLQTVLNFFPPGIADIIAELDGAASLRHAWIPRVRPCNNLPITASKFGGLPFLKSDEKWPVCSGCNQNLTFFFQLRGCDLPFELGQEHIKGDELMQMFVCTAGCLTFEPFSGSHCVRVVDFDPDPKPPSASSSSSSPSPSPAFADIAIIRTAAASAIDAWQARRLVGWKRTVDVPHYEDFEQYGLEEPDEETFEEDEAFPFGGEKLSGFPNWVQSNEQPRCNHCNSIMDFVFQVGSNGMFDHMFGDCGIGHITQCPTHKEVLAFAWACS